MSADTPTHEDIMRVRRWECSTNGHDLVVVEVTGSSEPRSVVCDRCGETWKVLSNRDPSVPEP